MLGNTLDFESLSSDTLISTQLNLLKHDKVFFDRAELFVSKKVRKAGMTFIYILSRVVHFLGVYGFWVRFNSHAPCFISDESQL